MKYLGLIWASLWRKPVRSFLTVISIFVAFLLFGLTWHVHGHNPSPLVLVVGFLAVIGSFMVSYTADKYDRLMKSRIDRAFRIGRDIRVFLIFCAALLNLPYLMLMAIAVLMNGESIRRIIVCREHEVS